MAKKSKMKSEGDWLERGLIPYEFLTDDISEKLGAIDDDSIVQLSPFEAHKRVVFDSLCSQQDAHCIIDLAKNQVISSPSVWMGSSVSSLICAGLADTYANSQGGEFENFGALLIRTSPSDGYARELEKEVPRIIKGVQRTSSSALDEAVKKLSFHNDYDVDWLSPVKENASTRVHVELEKFRKENDWALGEAQIGLESVFDWVPWDDECNVGFTIEYLKIDPPVDQSFAGSKHLRLREVTDFLLSCGNYAYSSILFDYVTYYARELKEEKEVTADLIVESILSLENEHLPRVLKGLLERAENEENESVVELLGSFSARFRPSKPINKHPILIALVDPTKKQEASVQEVMTTSSLLSAKSLNALVKSLYGVRFNSYDSTRKLYDRLKALVVVAEAEFTYQDDFLVSFNLGQPPRTQGSYSWKTEETSRISSVSFPKLGVKELP